jgi:osmoprotectant transport system substrate-binding protein
MGSTDPAKALANLNSLIKSEGLIATPTSPAADENAFAVTNDFAKKNNLTTISDLAKLNGQLVLGGPAECPTRPYCELGLEQTYGLQFKNFVTTDSGGQVTYTALTSGQIQVGLVFSSDGGVSSNNLTVLTDDKHLQNADNIVGLMKSTVPADAQAIINKVNQALTTSDLQTLNKQMSVDKDSATDLAKKWVSDHKLS